MVRIDDFGAHLSGAAKERWSGYRDAMGRARREAGDLLVAPLSEAFPEPPYARLIEDGADPLVIAFVRAARELIPARPRDPHRTVTWARTVLALRDLAGDLIDGSVDRDRVTTLLAAPAYDRFRDGLEGRMNLYLAIGHEQSLRGLRIVRNAYRQRDGVRHDPPQVRWDVVRDRTGRAAETIISELSRETAMTELRLRLSGEAARRPTRRAPIEIFSYRNRPERRAVIGVKNGSHLIELAHCPDVGAARIHLRENRNGLERRLAELRDLPPERGEGNRECAGPAVRTGDVSADSFLSVFGFRGVQFGNHVEGARRQADLNRAHDALLDLAGVLACAPRALSLGGTLGLAFGARGRGGKGAAAAHYEPEQRVINLTKTNGAGSLAHEWFHALDNHLARASGGRTSQYASELDGPGGALISHMARRTGMPDRGRQLDRVRSEPYYTTGRELAARGFEGFVIDRLAARGVVNDYLANVCAEEVFEAVSALRGEPPGGYPYPRATEIFPVRDAYQALLAAPQVRALLGIAPDRSPPRDPQARSTSLTRAAAPFAARTDAPPERVAPERDGPELRPGPSDTPDFDW